MPRPYGRASARERLAAAHRAHDARDELGPQLLGDHVAHAGVHLQLERYDRSRVHGSVIPVEALHGLFDRLVSSTVEEIRALPSMHPGRADVVTAGTLIAVRIADRLRVAGLLVSESDILDGTALELLHPSA